MTRTWLEHRRLPIALAILALLLTLPSLWTGLIADDYYHRIRLLGWSKFPELSRSPLELFTFADGDPERTGRLMDIGVWPWWTLPELRVAFFRPIAAATHWLDYQLWPDRPAFMHAHSVLWFAGLIGATAVLYRRFMGFTVLAGLAALLYAIDDARGMPVGFLANRNALIAAVFGVLAIITHDRWRRGGWRIGAVVAPSLLAASLLSAEIGLGALAYLLAHVLFLDRGTGRQRVLVLLPYVMTVLIWRLLYTYLGYGVWGLGPYVDPVTEPLRYSAAVLERVPALLLGQLLMPPAEAYVFCLDFGIAHFYYVGAVLVLIVVAAVVIPRLGQDAMTRFWAVGMMLSLLPICATFPADRMLFFVGLGGCALVAQFLRAVFRHADASISARPQGVGRFAAKAVGILFVVVHMGFAPVFLAARSAMPMGPPSLLEKIQVSLPMGAEVEQQSVVVVTAPMPLASLYLPIRRALDGLPVPAHTRVLAPHYPTPVVIHRPDARTLVIRPADGYLARSADRLARGPQHPMSVGQRVELTGMAVEITALTDDGRPAEASFRFAVPLEDPSLRWVQWKDGSVRRLQWKDDCFGPFTPPTISESVELRPG